MDDEYYDDGEDAMEDRFEPKTPCEIMGTRPCVEVVGDYFLYPVEPCEEFCARFEQTL